MRDFPWALRAARKVSTANAIQTLTVANGSGTNDALLLNNSSKAPRWVCITSTVPILIRFGASGASSTSTTKADHYLAGNSKQYFEVPSDALYIDHLSVPAAAGTAYLEVLGWWE